MNKSVPPAAMPNPTHAGPPPAAPAARQATHPTNSRSGNTARARTSNDSTATTALQNPSPAELQAWLTAWAGPNAQLAMPSAAEPKSMSADSLSDTTNPWSQAAGTGNSPSEADGFAPPLTPQALTGPLRLQVEGMAGHLPFELVLNPMQNGVRVQLRARTERQRRQLVELVDEARREGRDADQTDIEVVLCTDTPSLPLPPAT